MRAIERLRARRFLLPVLAGLAIGTVAGLLWPAPPSARQDAPDAPLSVPGRQELARFHEADFAKLRDGRLWGGSSRGQPGSAKLSGWRLLGVLAGSAQTAFVQADRAAEIRQVTVGEALPDGTELLGVTAGGIDFQRNGCRFRRALYATEDVAIPSAGCDATPAASGAAAPKSD